MIPRGIRNRNPGNIRHSARTVWVGALKTKADPSFVTFRSPEYGLRAMMKILRTYYDKYALLTIRMMITRYAPPIENDTESYIAAVAIRSGVGADEVIDDLEKVIISLAEAIVLHENGNPPKDTPPYWYERSVYETAKTMVFS